MKVVDSLLEGVVEVDGYEIRYGAYFHWFNAGGYYEAHDVLENLWLEQDKGKDKDGNQYQFYKALIQVAGGFVHLRKQREFPNHRVHGKRLYPAWKLFGLALGYLEAFPDIYQGMDLREVRELLKNYRGDLKFGEFRVNPWRWECKPSLILKEFNGQADSGMC